MLILFFRWDVTQSSGAGVQPPASAEAAWQQRGVAPLIFCRPAGLVSNPLPLEAAPATEARSGPGAGKTTGIFGLPSPCCPSHGFQAASMASSTRLTHDNKRQPHSRPSSFEQSAGSVGRPTHRRPLALRQPCSCGGRWHLAGAPLHSPELSVGWQEFPRLTPTELTPNTTPLDKGGSNH